jgi:hypothetical protein
MGERDAKRDHSGVQEKERKKSNTKINNECDEMDARNN